MTPKNPDFEAAVRANFARQDMMRTLGAEIIRVAPGAVSITSSIPPGTGQQAGFAHGGLAFSIGDSACGYAAVTLLPKGMDVVTSEIKIHFLAPGKGDRLVAEGRVLKPGRRLIVSEAEVYAETGAERTLIAKLLGTMIPVPEILTEKGETP